MKKILLSLGFVCGLLASVQAQEVLSNEIPQKNMVKFNALTLIGGKFAFEYERLLTSRITVAGAISFRPSQKMPFTSSVKNILDDEEFDATIDQFKSSNFSITPEVRFYTSKRGPFRGFYAAPFVKYASYNIKAPFDFEVEATIAGQSVYNRTETIPLDGNIKTFTAGVAVGVNFKLTERVHLDWRIIGPGYGSSNGTISGKMNLNPDEQSALNEELNSLQEDLKDLPVGIKTTHTVNAEGATIKVKGPWASIRSGLSIAYRF